MKLFSVSVHPPPSLYLSHSMTFCGPVCMQKTDRSLSAFWLFEYAKYKLSAEQWSGVCTRVNLEEW